MTDPRYAKPALSTRGYVVAAVVPVLIAAGLFGLVVWNYDDADVQGSTAPLLVSSWKPGQETGGEQVVGVLEADDDGCPVLVTDSTELPVAWPAGWSARVSAGGTLGIYDPDGKQAVRVDQEVRATGDLVEAAGSPYAGRPCAPTTGSIAEIQSAVSVVG